MLSKIALIVPYIGKLPEFFNIWLFTCGKNPNIDWIVITDDNSNFNYPKNVKRILTTLEELKIKFQNNFDFPISLKSGYKLCDFRPAYGEIFKQELSNYDYWGYGDIDLIWGDVAKFISNYQLLKYDKALDSGHFTLYKNNFEINSIYKLGEKHNLLNYKQVFSSDDNFAFDEWGGGKGINSILLAEGKTLFYEKILFADIKVFSYNLETTRTQYGDSVDIEKKKIKIIYQYINGKLFQHYLESDKQVTNTNEELYIHLQKRRLIIDNDLDYSNFLIVPPNQIIRWSETEVINVKVLNKYGSYKKYYWENIYKIYKNLIKWKIQNIFK